MNEWERAARKHQLWFGSYTRAGELKTVHVWCWVSNGNVEFLTGGDSLKAKRAGRNPQVICHLGAASGPAVEGRAEIVRERGEVERGYRTYWKTHPLMMMILFSVIRKNIRAGKQVVIRVKPSPPNPLQGISDPADQ